VNFNDLYQKKRNKSFNTSGVRIGGIIALMNFKIIHLTTKKHERCEKLVSVWTMENHQHSTIDTYSVASKLKLFVKRSLHATI
jgi:hypothetical protein